MATNFPGTSIDDFPTVVDNVDDVLAFHINNPSDAVEALEAKVGLNNSVVSSSHDYKLRNLPAQDGTTKVTNLNADQLDGSEGSAYWPARTGDIMLSSSVTTPSGWSDVSATYNNKFIRISSSTPLTSGGTDTHIHGVGSYAGPSHAHGAGSLYFTNPISLAGGCCGGSPGNVNVNKTLDGGSTAAGGTGAITGTSASANNIPAYVQLRVYSKS